MSIEKEDGMYRLYCDICGESAPESFFEFIDAVQYKRREGWKSLKNKDEWEDVCPECQDGAVESIMEDLADALEKAIQLILDISIRKVAVPYDTIHRWENLIKCAREINC